MNFQVIVFTSLLIFVTHPILCQTFDNKGDTHAVIIEDGTASLGQPILPQLHKINPRHNSDLIHPLVIEADFEIYYIWIFNEEGIDIFDVVNSQYYIAQVPEGMYHIILGCSPTRHKHTLFIRDSILVTEHTLQLFLKEQANYTTKYELLREDAGQLRINTIYFRLLNSILGTGLQIKIANVDSTAILFKYTYLPNYLNNEWVVKGKPLANYGNLYLLNGPFYDYGKDTVITNDPINLVYADFYYHLPDSINKQYQAHVYTYIPSSHTTGPFDKIYEFPFTQRVFQDTSADLYLQSSIFYLLAENFGKKYIIWSFMYTGN